MIHDDVHIKKLVFSNPFCVWPKPLRPTLQLVSQSPRTDPNFASLRCPNSGFAILTCSVEPPGCQTRPIKMSIEDLGKRIGCSDMFRTLQTTGILRTVQYVQYFWTTPPEAPWMLHLNPEFLASSWCALSSPKPTRLATCVPCANRTRPSCPNKRRNSRRCQRPKNLHERALSPQKIWSPSISLRCSNSKVTVMATAGKHLMATACFHIFPKQHKATT